MIESHICPADRRMTIIAIIRRANMGAGFAVGDDAVVAGAALRRRPLEDAVYVAGFAIDRTVRTFERKACFDVIRNFDRRWDRLRRSATACGR